MRKRRGMGEPAWRRSMGSRPLAVGLLILAVVLVVSAGSTHAQGAPGSADAEQAEQEMQFAARWHDLAAQARGFADQTETPDVKQDWLNTAAYEESHAKALEDDAQMLRARSAATAAADSGSESTPTAPSLPSSATTKTPSVPAQSTITPFQSAPVESFYGMWIEGHGDWMGIKPQNTVDPDERYNLLLVTKKHEWIGTYNRNPGSNGSLMDFTFRPKAEDMNAIVPLWVRQQVEGQLVWTIKLNQAPICGQLKVEGEWYPGEIKWDEGSKKAWVSGKGDPIPLNYSYNQEISATALNGPELTIVTGNATHDSRINRVSYLMKGQLFRVEVRVPYDMAKTIGPKLDVKLTTSSGQQDDIELSAPPGDSHQATVRYADQDAVSINDFGLEANRRSTLGPIPSIHSGTRLALSVQNGELVTFSAYGAEQQVTLYNSWVQEGIARETEALNRWGGIFNAAMTDPRYSAAIREDAHQRLRLVQDARAIAGSDYVHDYIRYYVLDDYVNENGGLIFEKNPRWITAKSFSSGGDVVNSPFGFIYADYNEAVTVGAEIVKRRAEYRDQLPSALGKGFAFALYEFVATSTPVGDLWVLTQGTDIYGHRADRDDYIQAAWNIALFAVSHANNTKLGLETATSQPRINRLGAEIATKPIRINARTGLVQPGESAGGGNFGFDPNSTQIMPAFDPGASPPPVFDPSKGQVLPALDAANDGAVKEPLARCPSSAANGASSPASRAAVLAANKAAQLQSLQQAYGPTARFIDDGVDYSRFLQLYDNTCGERANNALSYLSGGDEATERDDVVALKDFQIFDQADPKFAGGMSINEINQSADLLGGAATFTGDIPFEGMRNLQKQGYAIRLQFEWFDQAGNRTNGHVTALKDFGADATGNITEVHFIEPSYGRLAGVSACDLPKVMASRRSATILKFAKSQQP